MAEAYDIVVAGGGLIGEPADLPRIASREQRLADLTERVQRGCVERAERTIICSTSCTDCWRATASTTWLTR